jgi:hypothetical protein
VCCPSNQIGFSGLFKPQLIFKPSNNPPLQLQVVQLTIYKFSINILFSPVRAILSVRFREETATQNDNNITNTCINIIKTELKAHPITSEAHNSTQA